MHNEGIQELVYACRDRAAETLQWLVNDSPDVQSLVLEHKALDTLLALMDDTLEDGTITDACTYSSICLYHLSKHQRHIVETIAHAGIIPRYAPMNALYLTNNE